MNNRRLLIAILLVVLFAIGIIAWFFFYATPSSAPSLNTTKDPLSLKTYPKGFQFLFNNNDEVPPSESTTEVTFQKPEVLTEIWHKPATGQTFTEVGFVREIDATSTQGTTTISVKKLAHATTTLLLFVDRTTGYVYSYDRSIGKIYQISNTTMPGIHDAYIFNHGKNIILRYADNDKHTIVGVLATIPSVSDNEQAKPLENITYLPSQVTSVAVNKKGDKVSYLVTGDAGGSVYTLSATSKNAELVTTTPFKEWTLTYGGDTLFATSKPSAYVEGQTVRLPSFDFTVGGKTGLMSNPGESGVFLASMWSNTGLKTFLSLYGKQAVLPITTLASKCAWGTKNFLVCAVPKILPRKVEGLPDDWFQGRFSFNDSLVEINVQTAEAHNLYTFDLTKYSAFDITNLSVSSENTNIAFIKKQDSSLWLLDTTLISSE